MRRASRVSNVGPAPGQGAETAALRQALGCFVTGVTVVTARGGDGLPHGFTANSFASVSLAPPLVLVCVGDAVQHFEVYRECERFAINILADSQRVISDTFATDRPDRFARVRWREGPCRSPILEGCVAFLECAPWRRIEAGDHMILIGRVLAFEHSKGRPLACCRGSYASLPLESDAIGHEDGCPVRPDASARIRS